MKNKEKILLLVLLVFGIVTTMSSVTALSEFDKSVNIGGETFYIPEGYELNSSKYEDSIYSYMYTNENYSGISFLVYPNSPFTIDQFRTTQENAGYYTYSLTIGNYSGFEYTSDSGIKSFCFERNGSTIIVMLTSDFDFEDDLEKIIEDKTGIF